MSKKDLLLGKSRALVGGRKLTSLSDFQETPMDDAPPAPGLIQAVPAASALAPALLPRQEAAPAARPAPLRREEGTPPPAPAESVQTRTYVDVQRRTKVAVKLVRENFRFTVELANALEDCAVAKRLKKNTVVEIALEQHLKQEGYL